MKTTIATHARSLRLALLAALVLIPVAYDQIGHGRVSPVGAAVYVLAAGLLFLAVSRTLLASNPDHQSPPA